MNRKMMGAGRIYDELYDELYDECEEDTDEADLIGFDTNLDEFEDGEIYDDDVSFDSDGFVYDKKKKKKGWWQKGIGKVAGKILDPLGVTKHIKKVFVPKKKARVSESVQNMVNQRFAGDNKIPVLLPVKSSAIGSQYGPGWIADIIRKAGKEGAIVFPNKSRIAMLTNALTLAYVSIEEVVDACAQAVQGSIDKIVDPQWGITGAPTVCTIAGSRFWGGLLRISDSWNLARKNPINVAVAGVGLTPYNFVWTPDAEYSEILIFSVSLGQGQGKITPSTTITATVPANELRSGALAGDGANLYLEGLNARDLGFYKK